MRGGLRFGVGDAMSRTVLSLIGLGAILIGIVAVYLTANMPATPDYAFGCDPFGYARQEKLFRDEGYVDGIDTRVRAPEAQLLIDLAKGANLSPDQYGEMIAPHCNHYEVGSDSVITQYPPGAGFLMSLLPPDRTVQALYVLSFGLLVGSFGIFAVIALPALLISAATIGGLAVVAMAFNNSALMISASMPPTIGLAALAVLVLLAGTPQKDRPRWWAGALLGFVGALLVSIRIANVFLLLGMVVFILAAATSIDLRRLRALALYALCGLVVFAICIIPLLAANEINAGGIFESTYGVADSAAARIDAEMIRANLAYYAFQTPAWPVTWAALAAIAAAILGGSLAPSPDGRRRAWSAALGGAVPFALSVAYFSTHEIRASYYLVPGAAFCVTLCLFALAQVFGSSPVRRLGTAVVAVGVLALVVGQTLQLPRHQYPIEAPAEILQPDVIVWADMTSGTLFHYLDKYASKIPFADNCVQNTMINAVSSSGTPQYFVVDSESMERLLSRLQAENLVEEIGTLQERDPRPVYRLDPGKTLRGGC